MPVIEVALKKYNYPNKYPNIGIALRSFLTLPVTVATCECSFSKLKLRTERMNELINNF